MARIDNFHSRLVAWMKIILPLTALGLLSTLFLISQTIDPTQSLPAATIDLASRAQGQGATNASFAGVTGRGDELRITAATARPTPGNPRLIHALDVVAEIQLISGAVVDIVSDSGDVHQGDLTAVLEGDVRLMSTTGYDVRTARLDARLDRLFAETPGAVTATGPAGDLVAGRMVLSENPDTGAAHLHFTNGVKLIYTPQPSEDD
ncbi:MAG: hypothetical protein AAGA28_04905 [Pseudomonadota bacterium]